MQSWWMTLKSYKLGMGFILGTQATVEKRWGRQEFYWHSTFSRSFFFLKRFFSLTCRASFLQIPGGQTFWFFFSAQFDQILETRVRKCLGKVYLSIMFSSVHWSFFLFFLPSPPPYTSPNHTGWSPDPSSVSPATIVVTTGFTYNRREGVLHMDISSKVSPTSWQK